MSKKVEMFRCDICGTVCPTEYDAKHCEFEHQKSDFANYMLKAGKSLGYINCVTAMLYALPDELKGVTKNTLFKISYLQCKEKPIYRICSVGSNAVEVMNAEDYKIFIVDYDDLIRGMEKKCES